jgi:hypothetical protein
MGGNDYWLLAAGHRQLRQLDNQGVESVEHFSRLVHCSKLVEFSNCSREPLGSDFFVGICTSLKVARLDEPEQMVSNDRGPDGNRIGFDRVAIARFDVLS